MSSEATTQSVRRICPVCGTKRQVNVYGCRECGPPVSEWVTSRSVGGDRLEPLPWPPSADENDHLVTGARRGPNTSGGPPIPRVRTASSLGLPAPLPPTSPEAGSGHAGFTDSDLSVRGTVGAQPVQSECHTSFTPQPSTAPSRSTEEPDAILSVPSETLQQWAPPAQALSQISGRHAQVLHLLAEGFTTAQIARQLLYSESAIKKFVSDVMEEIGARNRVQAVAIAIRRGLI